MSIQAPSQFVFNRLPEDDEELWWTIRALWGYTIPRTKVCPTHTPPFQAVADAFFARHAMTIWKGSRGLAGKSRSLALLGLTEAALLGCEVSILGGSGAQSLNVHAATQSAWHWHAAPRGLLSQDPSRYYTYMKHGGSLQTLTASQNSVRGPHPPRLRMDEIDEMDLDILEAALGQPMEQQNYLGKTVPTQTVMSSTHQYPDKTMNEMLKRAKEAGWPVYEWCYKDTSNPIDGWLKPEAVERTRSIIPEHMWRTEYDLQEPSFEGRAFDTDMVDAAFDPGMGVFAGDKPIISPQEQGAYYITAVDWAKEQDQTIIATYDSAQTPWVCVAWQRCNRQPWPMMVSKALSQWRHFGGKFVHDATGVGNVVEDLIREQANYHESKAIKGVVLSHGRERQNLFSEYIACIEHGDMKYPRIEYAWAEHRYCTVDDLYGRGHPPDSVIVGALAWSMRKKKIVLGIPTGGTRAASPWQIS